MRRNLTAEAKTKGVGLRSEKTKLRAWENCYGQAKGCFRSQSPTNPPQTHSFGLTSLLWLCHSRHFSHIQPSPYILLPTPGFRHQAWSPEKGQALGQLSLISAQCNCNVRSTAKSWHPSKSFVPDQQLQWHLLPNSGLFYSLPRPSQRLLTSTVGLGQMRSRELKKCSWSLFQSHFPTPNKRCFKRETHPNSSTALFHHTQNYLSLSAIFSWPTGTYKAKQWVQKKINKSLYSSVTDNAPTSGKFPTSISSKRQSRSKSSISKSILHCPSRRKAILNQVSLVSRYCLALQVLSASTVYNLVHQDTLSSKTDISFQRRNILISHTHLNNGCFNLTNNKKKNQWESK